MVMVMGNKGMVARMIGFSPQVYNCTSGGINPITWGQVPFSF